MKRTRMELRLVCSVVEAGIEEIVWV